MSTDQLLLDPAIRDWVIIPMFVLLLLVGMGRHYVQILSKSDPKPGPIPKKKDDSPLPPGVVTDLGEVRYKQTVMRSAKLRTHNAYISTSAYELRKNHFLNKENGLLREKVPGASNPMMSNPSAMIDMMKGNLTFMLPNIAMMTFVGYFFNGFVCLKVPFSLPSNRFKLMMQRGVDLATLDVSYVSSISWYFLLTFGLNGVYSLILGDDVDLDDSKMMQMQMQQGMGRGGPQMFDATAAYRFERDMLSISKHEFMGDKAEALLLGDRYPMKNMPEIDLSSFNK